jgi:hypothetical protein
VNLRIEIFSIDCSVLNELLVLSVSLVEIPATDTKRVINRHTSSIHAH